MKIGRPEEYKLYLKLQIEQYVKDPKKVKILVEEYYLAFRDGIKFGQGKLVIEDD